MLDCGNKNKTPLLGALLVLFCVANKNHSHLVIRNRQKRCKSLCFSHMINEIHESIWQIDSGQDGPVVALLGGTHGNERTGIEVVRKLQSQFASGERTLLTGTFFLVLGNLKAIELNQRGTVLGQDLNRMFYQERIDADPDGTFEDARMRVMQPILATCDISIDIHSTNKPSQAFWPVRAR